MSCIGKWPFTYFCHTWHPTTKAKFVSTTGGMPTRVLTSEHKWTTNSFTISRICQLFKGTMRCICHLQDLFIMNQCKNVIYDQRVSHLFRMTHWTAQWAMQIEIHSFIHSRIYIAPLQGNYSEVLPTPARSKRGAPDSSTVKKNSF